MKKIIAFMLVVLMIIPCVSLNTFAFEEKNYNSISDDIAGIGIVYEDKGIIVNSVPTLTKTYSEYTVKIPYDEKGNRATKIFILMPSTLRIDYYDIQTDSNYLAFKVHDDNQTPYECIVRFEYSEDVSVNDFVSFDNYNGGEINFLIMIIDKKRFVSLDMDELSRLNSEKALYITDESLKYGQKVTSSYIGISFGSGGEYHTAEVSKSNSISFGAGNNQGIYKYNVYFNYNEADYGDSTDENDSFLFRLLLAIKEFVMIIILFFKR